MKIKLLEDTGNNLATECRLSRNDRTFKRRLAAGLCRRLVRSLECDTNPIISSKCATWKHNVLRRGETNFINSRCIALEEQKKKKEKEEVEERSEGPTHNGAKRAFPPSSVCPSLRFLPRRGKRAQS